MQLPSELLSQRSENKEVRSEKIYIFSKKSFCFIWEMELSYIFLKKVFLIFPEMEFSRTKKNS